MHSFSIERSILILTEIEERRAKDVGLVELAQSERDRVRAARWTKGGAVQGEWRVESVMQMRRRREKE